MTPTRERREEIAERGEKWYEERIRTHLTPADKGKYLVINVETGEYVMDPDDLTAARRARTDFPNAPRYAKRIGYATVYNLGGSALNEEERL